MKVLEVRAIGLETGKEKGGFLDVYCFSFFCSISFYLLRLYPSSVRIPGVFILRQVLLLEVQYSKVVQLFIASQIILTRVKCAEKQNSKGIPFP